MWAGESEWSGVDIGGNLCRIILGTFFYVDRSIKFSACRRGGGHPMARRRAADAVVPAGRRSTHNMGVRFSFTLFVELRLYIVGSLRTRGLGPAFQWIDARFRIDPRLAKKTHTHLTWVSQNGELATFKILYAFLVYHGLLWLNSCHSKKSQRNDYVHLR